MHTDHVTRVLQQWRVERPDLDASPIGIVGRLSRLALLIRHDLVTVYDSYGLSEGEFDILATIRRQGAPFECSHGTLIRETMVTKSAVSKRLAALEARGLVARAAAQHDGRSQIVQLTPAGRRLLDRAFEEHLENERRVLSVLSASDRDALQRILATWMASYEDGVATGDDEPRQL